MNINNPFIGKHYASGNDFVGREDELNKLRQLIHSRAGGISIVGQQRIGKTSIAKKIFHELRDGDKPTIWLDLGCEESPDTFFDDLILEVRKLFYQKSQEYEQYLDMATNAYRKFNMLLALLPKNCGRLTIFLDEFDAIRSFDKDGKTPQRLRALMDNCEENNITIVLISRRTIYALEHALSHCSTLDGQCTKCFVKPFKPDETQLLVNIIQNQKELTEQQRNNLEEFAGNHPYLLKIGLADFWNENSLSEQAYNDLFDYYEKLRELLNEDNLWKTLVQEIICGFHNPQDAEAYSRLEMYGIVKGNLSWSLSFDDYIRQHILDASLNEPWANTEINLRKLIAAVCRKKYGDNFLSEICKKPNIKTIFYGNPSNPKQDCCEKRKDRTKLKFKTSEINLLEYTYTIDLWNIISILWEDCDFRNVFRGNKEEWSNKFNFLGPMRNEKIAHNNSSELRDDQIILFYKIVDEINKIFKNFIESEEKCTSN